jgi:WASH complex subunit strumpellin
MLAERDEQLRTNYLELLHRFYLAFESIAKYGRDLIRFVGDLESGGIFIQQSLEVHLNLGRKFYAQTVLASSDGRQLMVEALFLYGVMLLVLDTRIDGAVRERMLVAYYRWKGAQLAYSNIEDVCNLCKHTGFSAISGKSTESDYPESYFKRIEMPATFVSILIGRLRTDDIYNQIMFYPLPEHRSTALATQASILFVLLYFAPHLLHNDYVRSVVKIGRAEEAGQNARNCRSSLSRQLGGVILYGNNGGSFRGVGWIQGGQSSTRQYRFVASNTHNSPGDDGEIALGQRRH